MLKKIKQIIDTYNIGNEIGNPPWSYYLIKNLEEKKYPLYLAKLFYLNTGERLPLRHGVIDKKKLKTFNQKIQWIKLYGVTDLMRDCTDKVKVRDYVKEKIGEEYLKPVLQIIPNESHETVHCHCEQVNDNSGLARQSKDICQNTPDCHDTQNEVVSRNDRESNAVSNYFDKIDFDKLSKSFVIKTNHGSKWHYIIKDREKFLQNERLFNIVKRNITGWLEQEYWVWNGFEMNYRNIEPKILIEPLLRDEINTEPIKINVYCFNGVPEIFIRFYDSNKMNIYDKNFEPMDNIFNFAEENIKCETGNIINQKKISLEEISRLSKQLAKDFCFVRVDWMIYQNKLYFEELTFTPYSGFHNFEKPEYNLKLGELMNI